MSNISNRSFTARILCLVLIAAMALSTAGCGTSKTTTEPAEPDTAAEVVITETQEEAPPAEEAEGAEHAVEEAAEAPATDVYTENTELGEGKQTFTFVVTASEDNVVTFTVHTDAATVGEALLAVNLIAGTDSEYGLYVKTVNGVTADYDKDGKYWAFYINGEYAMTGVDATEVTDGATYGFTVE